MLKIYTKYEYDRDYFKNIDTEEKAYWLGFITADGNIQDNRKTENKSNAVSLRIRLSVKDKIHLELFNKHLKSNKNITYPKNYGVYGDNPELCMLEFNSKQIVDDLKNKGITSNKTTKETPYKQINRNFIKDYIRGIFDGDGSIYYNPKNKKGNKEWSIFSSMEMCEFIKDYLSSELDIKFNKITSDHRCEELLRLRTCSGKNIEKIYNHLYYKDCISLKRKENIIKNLVEDLNSKKPSSIAI